MSILFLNLLNSKKNVNVTTRTLLVGNTDRYSLLSHFKKKASNILVEQQQSSHRTTESHPKSDPANWEVRVVNGNLCPKGKGIVQVLPIGDNTLRIIITLPGGVTLDVGKGDVKAIQRVASKRIEPRQFGCTPLILALGTTLFWGTTLLVWPYIGVSSIMCWTGYALGCTTTAQLMKPVKFMMTDEQGRVAIIRGREGVYHCLRAFIQREKFRLVSHTETQNTKEQK